MLFSFMILVIETNAWNDFYPLAHDYTTSSHYNYVSFKQ